MPRPRTWSTSGCSPSGHTSGSTYQSPSPAVSSRRPRNQPSSSTNRSTPTLAATSARARQPVEVVVEVDGLPGVQHDGPRACAGGSAGRAARRASGRRRRPARCAGPGEQRGRRPVGLPRREADLAGPQQLAAPSAAACGPAPSGSRSSRYSRSPLQARCTAQTSPRAEAEAGACPPPSAAVPRDRCDRGGWAAPRCRSAGRGAAGCPRGTSARSCPAAPRRRPAAAGSGAARRGRTCPRRCSCTAAPSSTTPCSVRRSTTSTSSPAASSRACAVTVPPPAWATSTCTGDDSRSTGCAAPPSRWPARPGAPDQPSDSTGSSVKVIGASSALRGTAVVTAASTSDVAARAGRAELPEVGAPVQHPRQRRAADVQQHARAGCAQQDQAVRLGRRRLAHPLLAPSVRPGDELLLQQDEDDDGRDGGEHRPGGEQVVVGEELAAQVLQGRRDRELVALAHEGDGPEEVVVDPGDLERGQRGQRRAAQRQDDLPELAQHAGAVHDGRLGQLLRERLHVVAQHEGAEPGLEGDVGDDHRPVAVVERAGVAEPERHLRPSCTAGTAAPASPAAAAGSPP